MVRRTAGSVTEISQAARLQAKSTEEVNRRWKECPRQPGRRSRASAGRLITIRGLGRASPAVSVSSVGRFKIREKRPSRPAWGVSAALREEEIDLRFLETK